MRIDRASRSPWPSPTALAVAAAILPLLACGADPASTERAAAPRAAPSPTAAAVVFEAAYPEEVSTEGLSKEDVEQQQTMHSHGGEPEHTHAAEGEGEEDHGHPH